MSDRCTNCGGSLIGDGVTAVIHCENATDIDAIAEAEADAGPIYCETNFAPTPRTRRAESEATVAFCKDGLPESLLQPVLRESRHLERDLTAAREEVARLREALQRIASECIDYIGDHDGENGTYHICHIQNDARAALAGGKGVTPNAHALAEERSDDSQQRVVGGKVGG